MSNDFLDLLFMTSSCGCPSTPAFTPPPASYEEHPKNEMLFSRAPNRGGIHTISRFAGEPPKKKQKLN